MRLIFQSEDRKVNIVVNYDCENNLVCFSHNGRGVFETYGDWQTQNYGKQNDAKSVDNLEQILLRIRF